jgi:phage protein D
MLTSLLGIRLILWMGSPVPKPAPYDVMSSLANVEVINDMDTGDGFQITFTLGKGKDAEYSLLKNGSLEPFSQVVIGVLMGASPEALINGVITHHEVSPSNDPGMSTLTVMGKDVSIMLDLEERNEKYENQPDSLIATQLIMKYAKYGLVPQITPTTDVPIMIQRIPRQNETDLKFVQRLARRNGFVFYIEPATLGISTVYWGPETRTGVPQPALTMNMGAATNVSTLRFSNDSLAPVEASGNFVEPVTKTSIPVPQLPSLRVPPLASSSAPAKRRVLMRNTANQNPAQAAASALSAVSRAPEPVKGEGELDSVRYGSVLRARRPIGLRGAGLSYNGNYYVKRVRHIITRGSYKQQFTLSREGTGTLLPVVRP